MYFTSVSNATCEEGKWPWAAKNRWQSWRDRYVGMRDHWNIRIAHYQEIHGIQSSFERRKRAIFCSSYKGQIVDHHEEENNNSSISVEEDEEEAEVHAMVMDTRDPSSFDLKQSPGASQAKWAH
ncbi:hypothetical protein BDQ17DRAFT_1437259 [Cyathus striatus]|nr:hypothetical protein BDQ17DRAFT_1437259 [Cyathus striatus]